MHNLPMPSDVRKEIAAHEEIISEPPSAKLLVRLFLIPFMIVALAVGIVYLISLMAGGSPSADEAIKGLKSSGGERTADVLIGPGAKQRYLYAKSLTDAMKLGMPLEERTELSGQLVDLLDNYTKPEEGEVQHFLLLALGRAWQIDPSKNGGHPQPDTSESRIARQQAIETLIKYAKSTDIATRKAALLATVYLKGHDQDVKQLLPILCTAVRDDKEDLDVRLSAATALGPLAKPDDSAVIDALHTAYRDTDPKDVELVWQSALSLAELRQPEVADTILKLLSRDELAGVQVYDRETDPKNPAFRKLSEAEQERILINTMIGVEHYDVASVQAQLKKIATSDPSQRVRAALAAKSAKDAAE